ncbi:MAG: hypothetical protein AAB588_00360 [Patescibacteria group bacterium]
MQKFIKIIFSVSICSAAFLLFAVPASAQSTKLFDYGIEIKWSEREEYGFTSKLYKISRKTGKKSIVLQNVRDQLPDLKVTESLTLIAQPYNSNAVFFSVTMPETDAGYGPLYKFNTQTKKFKKMAINSIWAGGWMNFTASPDSTRLAYVPDLMDQRTLYICDLLKDSCKLLVTLPENESFNGGSGGGLGSEFTLHWRGSNIVGAEHFEIINKDGNNETSSRGAKEYSIYFGDLAQMGQE